jgi:hypothetical protein
MKKLWYLVFPPKVWTAEYRIRAWYYNDLAAHRYYLQRAYFKRGVQHWHTEANTILYTLGVEKWMKRYSIEKVEYMD